MDLELNSPVLVISGILAPTRTRFWEYFNGLENFVRSKSIDLFFVDLPSFGTISKRGEIIQSYIDKNLSNTKYHVICHSKGGVDFRSLLELELIPCENVLSVTSISCPYKGSKVASFFKPIFSFLPFCKQITETINELTPNSIQGRFKKKYSFQKFYVTSSINSPRLFSTYPLFFFTSFLINFPNDGFVSKNSCVWGDLLSEYNTDHIGLIGHFFQQFRKFDVNQMYQDIFYNLVKVESK